MRNGFETLRFRSLFMHAWDLEDHGVDCVMEWMSRAGLNTMCLAAIYHSGWFIHPHNSRHRAYMAESGACYFHPHEKFYNSKKYDFLKMANIAKQRDWLLEASKRLDRHGLQLVAWIVGTHNTRLGLVYPELTQQNVYGDRLPHALCPANGEVREYLSAICRNIAVQYPVSGLQLESFGWSGFSHGHHHERDLVELSPLEQELMAFCVCDACSRIARQSGVDVVEVKKLIKSVLDTTFREAPLRPMDHPAAMPDLESRFPALKRFNQWRKDSFSSLMCEIKTNALAGTDCKLLLQSGYEPALSNVVDGFACGAYQKRPDEVRTICQLSREVIPEGWRGLLQCFIQLGMSIPESKRQLESIIVAVGKGGCSGINFYNHSESPPKMLQWLAETLPAFCE
jgi:hypothetical protein